MPCWAGIHIAAPHYYYIILHILHSSPLQLFSYRSCHAIIIIIHMPCPHTHITLLLILLSHYTATTFTYCCHTHTHTGQKATLLLLHTLLLKAGFLIVCTLLFILPYMPFATYTYYIHIT